ncbi:4688_t:CDS:1, partial [Funneliformis geosporum]
KLHEIREKAKQIMIAFKSKQKTAHDKQMVKPKSFDIGQKVLYYDAAKMNQFTVKLEPKWKGSYRIHKVLINGSYKIREIDGQLLARPVN